MKKQMWFSKCQQSHQGCTSTCHSLPKKRVPLSHSHTKNNSWFYICVSVGSAMLVVPVWLTGISVPWKFCSAGGLVCYFSNQLLPWSLKNSKKNIINKAWQSTIASEYFKYPVFPFMLESKEWILCIKNRKHNTIISFFNVHRTKIVTCLLIDIYFSATLFYLTLSVACNVFPSINW